MKNIVLIGFMGVGKSTIARLLSEQIPNTYVLDTDSLIENIKNTTIKNIFDTQGEKYFRQIEQQTANWLESSVKNSIIATGGGFYKVKNLKSIGLVIYLKNDFENIINNLKNTDTQELEKRPLLSNLQKAKELYVKRAKDYTKKAELIIDISHNSVGKAIEQIVQGLG